MSFAQTLLDSTEEQALAVRDWWRAQSDDRLRDLAWWVHDDGGPIDRLDGTVASIAVLRAWAKSFEERGLPTAPPRELFRDDRPWELSADDPRGPHSGSAAMHLLDLLAEYALRVLQRRDPGARWDIFGGRRGRIPASGYHGTHVTAGDGRLFESIATRLLRSRDDYFDAAFSLGGEIFDATPDLPPVPLLSELLDRPPSAPRDRPGPPDVIVPRVEVYPWVAPYCRVVIDSRARSPRIDALPPLDATALAAALQLAGFRGPAGAVTAADLASGTRLDHLDPAYVGTPVARDGRPVGVLVEFVPPQSAFGRVLTDALGPAFRLAVPTAEWLSRAMRTSLHVPSRWLPEYEFPRWKTLTLAIALDHGTRLPAPKRCAPLDEDEVRDVMADGRLWPDRQMQGARASVATHGGTSRQVVVSRGRADDDAAAAIFTGFAGRAAELGATLYADGRALSPRVPLEVMSQIRLTASRTPDDSGAGVFVVGPDATSMAPETLPAMDRSRVLRLFEETGHTLEGRAIQAADLVDRARFGMDSRLPMVLGADRGEVRVLEVRVFSPEIYDKKPVLMRALAEAVRTAGLKLVVHPSVPPPYRARIEGWAEFLAAEEPPPPGEYVLARRLLKGEEENYARVAPLDGQKVLAALAETGAVATGAEADPFTEEYAQFIVDDGVVELTVVSYGGKPRAIITDVHGADDADWRPVYERLEQLAAESKARIVHIEAASDSD